MRSMNCETAADFLIEKITEAPNIVPPIETKAIKGNSVNTWQTKAIHISLAKQRALYCKYKTYNTQKARERYKKYKSYWIG